MAKRRGRGRRNGGSRRGIQIQDQYAGADSVKIERQISFAQNTHSLTTIVIGGLLSVNATTTTATTTFSFSDIGSSDDFASMSAQFNTFRVRSMMFDIYDVNPNVLAIGTMSTFHQSNASPAPQTQGAIMDRPDSQLVAPGTGKVMLFWRAKGTEENNFQGVNGFFDFGGMSINVPSVTTAATKYQIAYKCVVDFRGGKFCCVNFPP